MGWTLRILTTTWHGAAVELPNSEIALKQYEAVNQCQDRSTFLFHFHPKALKGLTVKSPET